VPDVKVFIRAIGDDGQPTELRKAMDAAGLGVWKLEKATGINHQHIANVANGKGGIERRMAFALADALDRDVDDLFSPDGKK
jgi:transcriptional regulator with XRE-family HTH domain